MQSETFLLYPGIKCRSLGDAEEKERGCEEDEQRWQRDRIEKARGTGARACAAGGDGEKKLN